MYQVSSSATVVRGHRRLLAGRRSPGVNRTVVLLGLTSLFTDIASEMVVAVLPLYLVYVGGFTPLAVGVIDGLYQGATAFVGLAGGYLGDRWRRHKEVAATGYGISAACKLALALVGTAVSAIGAVILLDRLGKGLRTAPRDAMISLSVPASQLAGAFGVHRALDTTGALLGPLLAFAFLALAPLAFESLFIVSFCFALLGLGILTLLVDGHARREPRAAPRRAPTIRGAFGLLGIRRFRKLIVAASALSLATAGDAFVFLALERELELGVTLFPLLFVASAGTFMVLAVPAGRLADRAGRGRMLLAGHTLLLGVYGALLAPGSSWVVLVAALVLLGAYYAATDGVLVALGSGVVPAESRGSGLALLRTATSLARLVAAVLFGLLWTLWGIEAALVCFAGALLAALVLSSRMLLSERPAHA